MNRIAALFLAALVPSLSLAQQPTRPSAPSKPRYEFRKDHDPDGTGKFYMGREIAQVMGHLGAGWLDRPEREKEEQPALLMKALKIKPGSVVCDLGAGSGYFTFRLAEQVGPRGKVLAVDIQPEMLAIIKKKMQARNITNVETILGTITDPALKPESVDLILLVDVYHEFSHPYEMTEAMVKALKPGGRLVLVEYRLEDPKVPIKLVHKMSQKQVLKEMSLFPLRHVETNSTLPWQHVIILEKIAPKRQDGKMIRRRNLSLARRFCRHGNFTHRRQEFAL